MFRIFQIWRSFFDIFISIRDYLHNWLVRLALIAGIGGAVALAIGLGVAFSMMSSTGGSNAGSANTETGQQQAATTTPAPTEQQEELPLAQQQEPEQQPATTATGQQELVILQRYSDTTENAFTIFIPADWTVNSNIARPPPLGLAQGVNFEARSPDQTKMIAFANPTGVIYNYPFTGQEGVPDSYGGIAYYYRTSDEYVRDFLLPEYQQRISSDMSLVDSRSLGQAEGITAGIYTFSYSKDGVPIKMVTILRTYGFVAPGGITPWYAAYASIGAPEEEFDEFGKLGSSLLSTARVNEQWFNNEVGKGAQISGQLTESSEAFFQNLEGWSEVRRGTHEEQDESGNVYEVPNSYSNWWRNPSSGLYVGTNTFGNPLPGENLVPLQPATR